MGPLEDHRQQVDGLCISPETASRRVRFWFAGSQLYIPILAKGLTVRGMEVPDFPRERWQAAFNDLSKWVKEVRLSVGACVIVSVWVRLWVCKRMTDRRGKDK